MAESAADFAVLARQCAAHLRDPAAVPPPSGVDPGRLALYRRLMLANVEAFMARAFPVLRSLHDEARWQAMIADYFARHRARTPLYPRMPAEFVHYLAHERADADDPPFLAELAHYEWLEAEVEFDPGELAQVAIAATPDLEEGIGVLNPVLRTHAYRYPVQRIGPRHQPTDAPPEATYLALFRRRDDSVRCMVLNAVAARLVELLQRAPGQPLTALFLDIARELEHPTPDALVAHGRTLLRQFVAEELLLGTRP